MGGETICSFILITSNLCYFNIKTLKEEILKIFYSRFIHFLALILYLFTFSFAEEFEEGGSYIFETRSFLSLGFQIQNKYVDILNLRGTEEITSSINPNSLGDYYSPNIKLGIKKRNLYFFSLTNRNIQFAGDYLSIYSINTFLEKNIYKPLFFFIGVKGNYAPDMYIYNLDYINYYIHKFKPNLSIEVAPLYVYFVITGDNCIFKYGVPKTEDPYIALKNMYDYSFFTGFNIKYKFFKHIKSIISFEIGYSKINSEIDTNLINYIPEDYQSRFSYFPIKINYDQTYILISEGIKISYKKLSLFGKLGYLRFFRSEKLDYINYNYIFSGKLSYALRANWSLYLEGDLFYRQFNGIVPFLYNEYSQTTFDHKYGYLEIGMVKRF